MHHTGTPDPSSLSRSVSCLRLRPLTDVRAFLTAGRSTGGGWVRFITCRRCVHFIISVTDIQWYSSIQCCTQTAVLLRLWLLRLKVKRGHAPLLSWLQGALPWGQRWLPWWHSSQQLVVYFPSDFLRHALPNLENNRDRTELLKQFLKTQLNWFCLHSGPRFSRQTTQDKVGGRNF